MLLDKDVVFASLRHVVIVAKLAVPLPWIQRCKWTTDRQTDTTRTSSKVSSQPLQLEVNSSTIFLLLNHKYHSDTSIHAQGVPAQEHSPSDLSKDMINHQRHSHKRNGINMGLQKNQKNKIKSFQSKHKEERWPNTGSVREFKPCVQNVFAN